MEGGRRLQNKDNVFCFDVCNGRVQEKSGASRTSSVSFMYCNNQTFVVQSILKRNSSQSLPLLLSPTVAQRASGTGGHWAAGRWRDGWSCWWRARCRTASWGPGSWRSVPTPSPCTCVSQHLHRLHLHANETYAFHVVVKATIQIWSLKLASCISAFVWVLQDMKLIFAHWLHFCEWTDLMCVVRLPFCVNSFPQRQQGYFIPRCFDFLCFLRSPFSVAW